MLKIIAMIDMNFGLADSEGNLLYNIPEEMKHFRETTEGHICVFGRKTVETLPDKKPLPNRRNILMTRNLENSIAGFESVTKVEDILKLAKEDDVYICGGGEIYKEFLPYADKLIISHVHEINLDARIFFPYFTYKEWSIESVEVINKEHSFAITNYNRKTN